MQSGGLSTDECNSLAIGPSHRDSLVASWLYSHIKARLLGVNVILQLIKLLIRSHQVSLRVFLRYRLVYIISSQKVVKRNKMEEIRGEKRRNTLRKVRQEKKEAKKKHQI